MGSGPYRKSTQVHQNLIILQADGQIESTNAHDRLQTRFISEVRIVYSVSLTHGIVLASLIAGFATIVALPRSPFKRAVMSVLGIIGWAVLPALALGAIGFAADGLVFLGSFTEDQPVGLSAWGFGFGALVGILLWAIRWYHIRREL